MGSSLDDVEKVMFEAVHLHNMEDFASIERISSYENIFIRVWVIESFAIMNPLEPFVFDLRIGGAVGVFFFSCPLKLWVKNHPNKRKNGNDPADQKILVRHLYFGPLFIKTPIFR